MSAPEFAFDKKPTPKNSNQWMLSFADLLSLILTFFVLIYAMAEPVQFTNEHKEDYNSSIAFQTSEDSSQIKSAKSTVVLDNEYLSSVLENKIANDEGMKNFNVRITDDKLMVATLNDNLSDEGIAALNETIGEISSEIQIISSDIGTARDVANKFKEIGIHAKISYFEDKSLQNKVEIIVYPKS